METIDQKFHRILRLMKIKFNEKKINKIFHQYVPHYAIKEWEQEQPKFIQFCSLSSSLTVTQVKSTKTWSI